MKKHFDKYFDDFIKTWENFDEQWYLGLWAIIFSITAGEIIRWAHGRILNGQKDRAKKLYMRGVTYSAFVFSMMYVFFHMDEGVSKVNPILMLLYLIVNVGVHLIIIRKFGRLIDNKNGGKK